MESKWFAIMVIGIMLPAMVAFSIQSWQDANIAIESAKAGLQECPNYRSNRSNDTIWMKVCDKQITH